MSISKSGLDSDDVIRLICKRVVRRLNKKFDSGLFSDDFPVSFSFFDALSIRWQDRALLHIKDVVEDFIDVEIENMSKRERALMEIDYDNDETMAMDVYDAFMKMLDEHYYLKKIQDFVYRY